MSKLTLNKEMFDNETGREMAVPVWNGDEDEILVEPPIELTSGGTYCIAVEDKSRHYSSPERNSCIISLVVYTYSGIFSPSDLIPDASVDLGVVDLKVNGIKKENPISGSRHSTLSYSHVNVIRGIKISLV